MVQTQRRDAVLTALVEEPGLLLAELMDRTGLDIRRLAPLLWSMEDNGLITHEGRRWYPAAPAQPEPDDLAS